MNHPAAWLVAVVVTVANPGYWLVRLIRHARTRRRLASKASDVV